MKNRLFVIIFILSFVFASSTTYAQNFSKSIDSKQNSAPDSEMTDQDLDNVLAAQGIPLYSKSDVLAGSESKYTLGPEDVIRIEIPRHPEVSGDFEINSEGKIQYGFVGDVEIAGLTKKEAVEKIKDTLGKYVISPEVLITIIGYNSKVVYVVGEVGAPGKIYMRGDTITIREALIQASLPLLTAKSGGSWLITPSDDGKPAKRKVNVYKLLYNGDLRENFVMKPGDTLYIPPTVLTKTMRAIQPVTDPVSNAAGTASNARAIP